MVKEAAGPALAPSLQHLPSSLPSLRALSLALDFQHVLGSRFGQEWQVLRSRFSPEWQFLRPRFDQVGPRFSAEMASFDTSFWPRMDRFGTSLLYNFGDLKFFFSKSGEFGPLFP
jgi:hypothetical protein